MREFQALSFELYQIFNYMLKHPKEKLRLLIEKMGSLQFTIKHIIIVQIDSQTLAVLYSAEQFLV